MSTNFYLKRIPTIDEVTSVQQAIDSATPEDIEDVICDQFKYVSKITKAIHLGKRNKGYKFNWEKWDNKYYNCSLHSIIDFLNRKIKEGWVIINEYQETFSVEEFLDDIHDCLYYPEGLTSHSTVVYDEKAETELRFSDFSDFR